MPVSAHLHYTTRSAVLSPLLRCFSRRWALVGCGRQRERLVFECCRCVFIRAAHDVLRHGLHSEQLHGYQLLTRRRRSLGHSVAVTCVCPFNLCSEESTLGLRVREFLSELRRARVFSGWLRRLLTPADVVIRYSHRHVTCVMPKGTGLNEPLILFQNHGESSIANVTVSYAVCLAGTHAVGLDCPPCARSALHLCVCSFAVDLGAHTQTSPISRLVCNVLSAPSATKRASPPVLNVQSVRVCVCSLSLLLQGMFNSALNATVCQRCSAGMFAAAQGQELCTLCSVGTFASSRGATVCSNCFVGKLQQLEGQTACSKCFPGTYAASQGLQQWYSKTPCSLIAVAALRAIPARLQTRQA